VEGYQTSPIRTSGIRSRWMEMSVEQRWGCGGVLTGGNKSELCTGETDLKTKIKSIVVKNSARTAQ
jgi:hypothetical protein